MIRSHEPTILDLPARAADHPPAALKGDPAALLSFGREVELFLETEDIQRLV
jgi:hypothetical protein